MNKLIFADQHHMSLYNSLRLLFEKRLGGTLYRPIGKEWQEKGIWRMAEIYKNSPVTIEQYLGIKDLKPDNEGIYHPYDEEYGYEQNAITLEKFYQLPIDIVIASLPEHIASFRVLCENHFNKPKLIYQVGNAWTIQEGSAKNILASAIIKDIPPDTHIVTYHQEFDLKNFYFEKPRPLRKIHSFINCFNTAEHYEKDWIEFEQLERMMTDWDFKSFGGSCRDGAMNGTVALANKMREANFIYHVKKYGDGYGHIIHNAFAVGRPVITRISDYKGKLAEPLLEDGVTCIDLDKHSLEEVYLILASMPPKNYEWVCQQVHKRFLEQVDFNADSIKIKKFLENLK